MYGVDPQSLSKTTSCAMVPSAEPVPPELADMVWSCNTVQEQAHLPALQHGVRELTMSRCLSSRLESKPVQVSPEAGLFPCRQAP
jgi:hypothetical protein